jgi:hypothetical protein
MTFSEFETRLNYYFNSTSERDVYALEKIFDGDVYPTMSTDEKRNCMNISILSIRIFMLDILY